MMKCEKCGYIDPEPNKLAGFFENKTVQTLWVERDGYEVIKKISLCDDCLLPLKDALRKINEVEK